MPNCYVKQTTDLGLNTNGIRAKAGYSQQVGGDKTNVIGQYAACTVLIYGQRINSCLSLAIMYDDAEIITVEGLARVAHSMNTSEYKSKG